MTDDTYTVILHANETAACKCCEAHFVTLQERDALRGRVGRLRRALRQLNKAHRVLWRVVGYRNEFHDFAVKRGAFIEFRNATEKK